MFEIRKKRLNFLELKKRKQNDLAVNVNSKALQFVAQRGSDLNSSPRSGQTNELKERFLCRPVLCGQSQHGLEHYKYTI